MYLFQMYLLLLLLWPPLILSINWNLCDLADNYDSAWCPLYGEEGTKAVIKGHFLGEVPCTTYVKYNITFT